jgi:hypothetical protein
VQCEREFNYLLARACSLEVIIVYYCYYCDINLMPTGVLRLVTETLDGPLVPSTWNKLLKIGYSG